MLSIPPAFPQTLPSFPGSVIANQTIAASPVSAFTTSVLAFSAQSASGESIEQSNTRSKHDTLCLGSSVASCDNSEPAQHLGAKSATTNTGCCLYRRDLAGELEPGFQFLRRPCRSLDDPPSISTAPLTKTNPGPVVEPVVRSANIEPANVRYSNRPRLRPAPRKHPVVLFPILQAECTTHIRHRNTQHPNP